MAVSLTRLVFKPKGKPALRWGRVIHFLAAATATAYGGHLGGYQGSVWTGIGCLGLGFLWELGNRYIPVERKDWHPFADALDFWAVVLGAAIASVGWILLAQSPPS